MKSPLAADFPKTKIVLRSDWRIVEQQHGRKDMATRRKIAGKVLFGDLRIVWLQAFVQASHSGKRMAAASEMGISPGELTKHIAKLEQWFGSPLMLTDSTALHSGGEAFLPVATRILEMLTEACKKPDPIEVPRISGADIQIP